MDYALNDDFDIHFTEWGKLVTVDGLREFQDDLAVQLHARERELFGTTANPDTVKERVSLIAYRLARRFGVIDSIASVEVTESTDSTDRLEVTIVYNTGDTFTETL